MKNKKNTRFKTGEIKKMRSGIYHLLERHNEQIIMHHSIEKAIDEAVDLRDINDNLETLIRDAMEAQFLVRWRMMGE